MAATVWKGSISFGLVSFPIRLFAAARPNPARFHMLHAKDLSRVREVWYCAEEDKPIDRSEMVKGYEASKGEYVVVDEADLKKVAPLTASTLDILQFVSSTEVDPIYLEKSYYVAPEEQGAKAYALFYAALKETKQNAVAKIAMHSREHVVLLRPWKDALVLHTIYYVNEMNAPNRAEADAKTKYSAKELELAKSLIQHLKAPFRPEQFSDTYRENVERLIEQKQKGQKVSIAAAPRKAKVVDLMAALKRSLKAGPKEAKPSPVKAKRSARRHAA